MNPNHGELSRQTNWGARCAAGFVTVALGAAVFGLSPAPEAPQGRTSTEPLPYAAALPTRTLDRAPLVQVRMLDCNEANCGTDGHDPRIPCSMYARGYRPKTMTEDAISRQTRANFVVQNPAWKWPQPNGVGTSLTVTYSYANLLDGGMKGVTAAQLKAGVAESLKLWAAVTPLRFVEVSDSGPTPNDTSYAPGSTPNLRFGHHAIDGASGVLAHAFYPFDVPGDGLSGDLHFDEGETWVVKPSGAKIDFIEVCVHELGHALGLAHSATQQAIMFPFYAGRYSGPGSGFIFPDDRDGIQAIYGAKPTNIPIPIPPIPIPTPTPTSTVVTVSYNAATKSLMLTGDGSANNLTISRSGTKLTLTAGTGTTLNYLGTKKSTFSILNVSGKVSIGGTMGSGSDSLTCVSLDVSTMQVDLSGGNDAVVLNLCNVTTLKLNGGSGTDTYAGSTSKVGLNLSTGFP